MSKKEVLNKIACSNIKTQLQEIEERARFARMQIQLTENNPEIIKITTQNVLFATAELRKDFETFMEVTSNVQ